MPSTSLLALARAAVASWGREVRIRDAERGRERVSGLGSSGMGGEREGLGESGMVGGVVVGSDGDVRLKADISSVAVRTFTRGYIEEAEIR